MYTRTHTQTYVHTLQSLAHFEQCLQVHLAEVHPGDLPPIHIDLSFETHSLSSWGGRMGMGMWRSWKGGHAMAYNEQMISIRTGHMTVTWCSLVYRARPLSQFIPTQWSHDGTGALTHFRCLYIHRAQSYSKRWSTWVSWNKLPSLLSELLSHSINVTLSLTVPPVTQCCTSQHTVSTPTVRMSLCQP